MEAQTELPPASEEVVESGPSVILLFLIFIPTFLVAYVIPFLATIYSRHNAKKWIFYWIAIILASLVLRPLLTFIFGAYGGAFLFLVTAAGLLYVSSNEKVQLG
jgi:type II secretory pathway component PulF